MVVNDAHCHFFSRGFLAALAREARGLPSGDPVEAAAAALGWEAPASSEALADRWVAELDRHGVARVALIASVAGDEESVAVAVRRHPSRFVGMFMLDPTRPDAVDRVTRGLDVLGLRGVCLFPAMHGYRLDDERVLKVVEVVAARPGQVVFVHCGVLSVGARKKLGLPSRFDFRLGDPLAVHLLAASFPRVPVIIPHFGAGFFREALMATGESSNILLDTSSSNSWIRSHPGLTLQEVFRAALEVVGPDRLLFGTDSSFFPRGWQRGLWEAQRDALDRLGVGSADQEKVFGGNFDRLFGRA
jgi:predicted TIM-barrel fold metal-dependent hydrolase